MVWKVIRKIIRFCINMLTIITLIIVSVQAGMQIQERIDYKKLWAPITVPPPKHERSA